MKILNLTTAIPSKYGTGADIASKHFIDAMKTLGHSVTVVGYRRWGDRQPYDRDTIAVGELHIETKSARWYPLLWALTGFLKQLPYSSAKYYSTRYIKTVETLLSAQNYNAIVLDHSSQLCWLEPLLARHRHLAILAHNLEHEVFLERVNEVQNPLLKWMYQRETRITQKIEERLAAIASGVWTLTCHDADYFTRVGKVGFVKAFELPASAIQPIAPSTPKTFDIGMVGGWIWKPNADGLHWFFEQVYPHLPATTSIQVAGRGADWLHDRYPNVTYWGFVEDARTFLSEARTIAIPSIRGGGIQIKSLEAIGLGLPIVATPFALRGIVQPPTTVQLAEAPEQFADCLQRAITHTPTVADLESVQIWTRDRRARFLQDVDTALNAL